MLLVVGSPLVWHKTVLALVHSMLKRYNCNPLPALSAERAYFLLMGTPGRSVTALLSTTDPALTSSKRAVQSALQNGFIVTLASNATEANSPCNNVIASVSAVSF